MDAALNISRALMAVVATSSGMILILHWTNPMKHVGTAAAGSSSCIYNRGLKVKLMIHKIPNVICLNNSEVKDAKCLRKYEY